LINNNEIFSLLENSINAQHLAPVLNDLIGNLFGTLLLPGSNENEYVMKGKYYAFAFDIQRNSIVSFV